MSKESAAGKEWDVTLVWLDGPRHGVLEHTRIPTHKIGTEGLTSYLKALLAKHSGYGADELTPYFVNKRVGEPQRRTTWDPKYYCDPEKLEHGFHCGTGPLFAFAKLPLTEEITKFVKQQHAKNAGR